MRETANLTLSQQLPQGFFIATLFNIYFWRQTFLFILLYFFPSSTILSLKLRKEKLISYKRFYGQNEENFFFTTFHSLGAALLLSFTFCRSRPRYKIYFACKSCKNHIRNVKGEKKWTHKVLCSSFLDIGYV